MQPLCTPEGLLNLISGNAATAFLRVHWATSDERVHRACEQWFACAKLLLLPLSPSDKLSQARCSHGRSCPNHDSARRLHFIYPGAVSFIKERLCGPRGTTAIISSEVCSALMVSLKARLLLSVGGGKEWRSSALHWCYGQTDSVVLFQLIRALLELFFIPLNVLHFWWGTKSCRPASHWLLLFEMPSDIWDLHGFTCTVDYFKHERPFIINAIKSTCIDAVYAHRFSFFFFLLTC